MLFKKIGKAIVCNLLEGQVRTLRQRNTFVIVAVAGSVGKTSTKLAIAKLLGNKLRVRYQDGNYNDRVTVPLVFFGEQEPSLMNVWAWLRLLARNQRQLTKPYPYDVVVIELGTDGPGQMKKFAYLQPEIGVLTAVSPEHMEYFKNLDAVADEELALADYSQQLLCNVDDIDLKYLEGRTYSSYAADQPADYQAKNIALWQLTGSAELMLGKTGSAEMQLPMIGVQGAKICLAAAAVGSLLGFSLGDIQTAMAAITPVPGRMQILPGIRDSSIIDDTYNASPLAVKAALDVLYNTDAPQRIALLGNMNELGKTSASAHTEVGAYCDPAKLEWVLTLGPDANEFLAPAAEKAGCKVASFTSPYEAGKFIKKHLKTEAVVLAKGSQNGVFAEEAVKEILAEPADQAKLVRQSPYWLKRKSASF
nr:Mur ligase middle domain protein [uncultured bacterium]